ncbi:MAG: hypothetical protein QM504_11870 [Pseudomonadota bacterium]
MYQELIIDETIYKNTNYHSFDSQCINLDTIPPNIDEATLTLNNPHLSSTGILVHDLTLTSINRTNLATGETIEPNWYSISYLEGNKLYSGRGTNLNDGSTANKRHTEINFDSYLLRRL